MTRESALTAQERGMLDALAAAVDRAPVVHRCVSCLARVSHDERLGACSHGLLCETCSTLGSECPQCAKLEEDERDAPDEAYDPDDFADNYFTR